MRGDNKSELAKCWTTRLSVVFHARELAPEADHLGWDYKIEGEPSWVAVVCYCQAYSS